MFRLADEIVARRADIYLVLFQRPPIHIDRRKLDGTVLPPLPLSRHACDLDRRLLLDVVLHDRTKLRAAQLERHEDILERENFEECLPRQRSRRDIPANTLVVHESHFRPGRNALCLGNVRADRALSVLPLPVASQRCKDLVILLVDLRLH